MSMPALLTACIGLFFLGITSSSSLGLQHPELLSEAANVKDVEPYDSKQNLQLMKVNQEEYAEKEANGGENQMGTLTEGSLQKRQAQHEGDGIYDSESEENSSENLVNKRLALIRRNAEEFGFKSRPGFRSWGGKRSKFTNWGGKRNTFSRWGGKRSKFNNWGGKRSGNAGVNVYDSQMASKLFAEAPDTVHAEERAYDFEKRDPEYPLPYEQEGDLPEIYLDQDFFKRDEFQTWAGKRAEKPMSPVVDYNKFSKWAGKRKFSNWAGKRGNAFAERPEDTSANWILRSYVDSILNTMKTEESGGKKIAVASRPFRDGADNEKTKVYSVQDTR